MKSLPSFMVKLTNLSGQLVAIRDYTFFHRFPDKIWKKCPKRGRQPFPDRMLVAPCPHLAPLLHDHPSRKSQFCSHLMKSFLPSFYFHHQPYHNKENKVFWIRQEIVHKVPCISSLKKIQTNIWGSMITEWSPTVPLT